MIYIYSTYLIISGFITIYIGNLLHHDGGIWLIDLLGDFVWVQRMNNLLKLGYYLVNLGYVFYTLSGWDDTINLTNTILQLFKKIGVILLILGYLHYQNIILISVFQNLNIQKKWKI